MTETEIRRLLAAAMAYDNRKPGEAAVMAWGEAAARAGWTFESALDAIHGHYSESTDFLMPGHVTVRIRKTRQLPGSVREVLALPSAPPAQPERIETILQTLARRLGWQVERTPDAPVQPVECPYCHALPGKPCVRQATRGPRRGQYIPLSRNHQSRVDIAKEIA